MEKPGYGPEITRAVRSLPEETIIQTADIARALAERFSLPFAQAKTITNVKLKRMADKGEIKRLHKGAYCQLRQTAFGRVTPSVELMMVRRLTLKDGGRIGYESGPSFFNRLGLSTLLPREIEITSNDFNLFIPAGCHIRLRKPPAPVTNGNWAYLQFIDAVDALPKAHIDADKPEAILRKAAQRQTLDPMTAILTARRHYSQKTLLRVVDIFAEV